MSTTLTIRDLAEPVSQGLRRRAMEHGRSVEAEARDILMQAVSPVLPETPGSAPHQVRGLWKGRQTTEGILNLTREG